MSRSPWPPRVALILALTLSGCVIAPLGPGGYGHDDGPVVEAAPPPPRWDPPPPSPGPAYAWIGGYWSWQLGRHVWIGGRWALPPAPGRVWVPGQWSRVPRGWRWRDGYWSRR
ncbi:MAG TPA: hypothetical protein PKO45_07835 [Rubrivivax sp.]|nr:hypothetical protein [Burkholderiales bacterium]HNT39017.1 hypothetical protein [Rubrivivax sp.]